MDRAVASRTAAGSLSGAVRAMQRIREGEGRMSDFIKSGHRSCDPDFISLETSAQIAKFFEKTREIGKHCNEIADLKEGHLRKLKKAVLVSYAIGVAVGLYAGLMIAIHYGWRIWG
jgi:hypothetical protein